jgi:hypothetical protein
VLSMETIDALSLEQILIGNGVGQTQKYILKSSNQRW